MTGDTPLDVIVVGAGLSGIAAGHHLQTRCPGRSWAILEGRGAIGGTWDLFRYPGVRSDSDMATLGYSFEPWTGDEAFASGPAIREYVRATARKHGIDRRIRFNHRVTAAAWDTPSATWTVQADTPDGPVALRCRFLFFCSGYYDYARGHEPDWPGAAQFAGRIVHPQRWPQDLDHAGRRVVVIGSGATAVTLVPAMARQAAHVTMLQRSPTWIAALPGRDAIGAALHRWLPARAAHALVRAKNILATIGLYQLSRRRPRLVGRWMLRGAHRALGPGFDVERHLHPRYDPWDQRLCIVPDADLFKAVRGGKADIVTDTIERFEPAGLRLASGALLEADIVVAATGLQVQLLGGATLTVDGRPVALSESLSWRGVMFSGVPNLALVTGYTNASWTLKAELAAQTVCRLLHALQARGDAVCMPVAPAPGSIATRPSIDLSSGYVQRVAHLLPRQGARKPWRIHQNYLRDLALLRWSPLRDGGLGFAPAGQLPSRPA